MKYISGNPLLPVKCYHQDYFKAEIYILLFGL